MNQLEAASIIENQALKSLMYKLTDIPNHPVRLIQASKSLIGLDLDNPNKKLLGFNSFFLKNNNYKSIKNKNYLDHTIKEVISIYDLEEAFANNDKTKAFDILHQLSKVSNPLHILEFLVEISLKQSGISFLIVWSIYRMVFFINQKDESFFLDLSIDAIFSDKFYSNNFDLLVTNQKIIDYSNLSISNIDLFSHLLEAYNSNLVRSDKIKPLISNIIARKFNYDKKETLMDFNSDFKYPQLFSIGRSWLLVFINNIDNNKITIELILFLDSIRCLYKFLNNSDYKLICIHFERLVKKFDI